MKCTKLKELKLRLFLLRRFLFLVLLCLFSQVFLESKGLPLRNWVHSVLRSQQSTLFFQFQFFACILCVFMLLLSWIVPGTVTNSYFSVCFLKKIENLPEGYINDAWSGRTLFSFIPSGNSLVSVWTIEELFELKRRPSRAFNHALYVSSQTTEIQGHHLLSW